MIKVGWEEYLKMFDRCSWSQVMHVWTAGRWVFSKSRYGSGCSWFLTDLCPEPSGGRLPAASGARGQEGAVAVLLRGLPDGHGVWIVWNNKITDSRTSLSCWLAGSRVRLDVFLTLGGGGAVVSLPLAPRPGFAVPLRSLALGSGCLNATCVVWLQHAFVFSPEPCIEGKKKVVSVVAECLRGVLTLQVPAQCQRVLKCGLSSGFFQQESLVRRQLAPVLTVILFNRQKRCFGPLLQ